jgi:hypothetical protein
MGDRTPPRTPPIAVTPEFIEPRHRSSRRRRLDDTERRRFARDLFGNDDGPSGHDHGLAAISDIRDGSLIHARAASLDERDHNEPIEPGLPTENQINYAKEKADEWIQRHEPPYPRINLITAANTPGFFIVNEHSEWFLVYIAFENIDHEDLDLYDQNNKYIVGNKRWYSKKYKKYILEPIFEESVMEDINDNTLGEYILPGSVTYKNIWRLPDPINGGRKRKSKKKKQRKRRYSSKRK